jgi:zinc transport system permease protein
MRNAYITEISGQYCLGIVGTLVVVNNISFLAGWSCPCRLRWAGLATFLGISPVNGISPFALGSSLLMGVVSRRNKERSDTVIGVMWAAGMAIGIILIDLKPGYYVDLMSYLFGSIMAVSLQNIFLMLLLDAIIISCVLFLYRGEFSVSLMTRSLHLSPESRQGYFTISY